MRICDAGSIFGSHVVESSPEIRRISALPRRKWTADQAVQIAAAMTRELRKPSGTMSLFPIQGLALYEMAEMGGLFGPIDVGGGKGLVSWLSPIVMESKSCVLLIPASLIQKTWAERQELSKHWYLPSNLELISYESLSLVQNVEKLNFRRPDLIVGDEAQYISNHRSGRGRRVSRYMSENPDTRCVFLSGTMMKKSITDFGRMARWALKDKAPVPRTDEELKAWSECLDEGVNPLARRRPGALMSLLGTRPSGTDSSEDARKIFQVRLLETPGVVASFSDSGVGCSILVNALEYVPSSVTEGHFKHVRKLWETPDEWTFMQAIELRMYLRQLSLGFHGVWDPRPPPEWLNARKAWAAFGRETLAHSRTLDTPLAVANAIDCGDLDDNGVLEAWRKVEKTFTIQPKPIWHDETALNVAADWGRKNKGIIWVEHRFFGHRLAKMLGCSYYGPGGLDERGASIKDAQPGKPLLASVSACKQGFNLQMFSANLITSCPSGSSTLEQLIGRTHRTGQQADMVSVEIMLGCAEQLQAFDKAVEAAKATEDTLGHRQKILLADITMPDTSNRLGPLWIDDKRDCDCPICS